MALRLAFLGTPDFAVPTLAELIGQGHDIACVYSQPPRPRGRGLGTEPSPVHALALMHKLHVRTPVTLRDAVQQELFAALELDAAVVVAYGLILPKPILAAPKLGCFNLHGSLLPRWRGAAPIQRSIMAGDAESGVMSMRMEAGLDTGPVLMAERIPIGRKTYGELHDELARLGADLMARTMGALERGTAVETPQPEDGVTYAKKIEKEEARIDWSKSAHEIDCHIRGLSPFPGAWSELKGERIKMLNCELAPGSGAPGSVLDDALTIACGEGAIRLTRLQRPSKAAMNATDLLRGFAVPRGAQFV
ncbi:MAG: methionyl-tRNA formyltransferase [Alphaproteobacteria bacterium]|nr:methionyl-tRNA formyltransferase [Alphaproteobacteria bacterium]MBL6937552.1 methionyl-tRNA formyltransferase [Alphaproteobacteria bacterium]MBL7098890.1 methionyl-tRNA formyltransferase [Alphaproteobacteria bacterium]